MDTAMLETQAGEISEDTRMQFEKGWLWEVALSRAFAEKAAVRPKAICLDGIWGSPDGVTEDGAVEEYKCTMFSATKTPADMWRWIMQTKAYCKMLNTRRCVFHILHLSFVPVYHVWELVFSEREIEENWQAILNRQR